MTKIKLIVKSCVHESKYTIKCFINVNYFKIDNSWTVFTNHMLKWVNKANKDQDFDLSFAFLVHFVMLSNTTNINRNVTNEFNLNHIFMVLNIGINCWKLLKRMTWDDEAGGRIKIKFFLNSIWSITNFI